MDSPAPACGSILLFVCIVLVGAGCAVADGSCPECPDGGRGDAAVSCSALELACADASFSVAAARCSYVDDPSACVVRSGTDTVACASCDDCSAAIARLRLDACRLDVDECAAAPCRNGGQCENRLGGFHCTCASGFTGPTCEVDVDECVGNPCGSLGSCSNLVGSYVCTCAPGYTGSACTVDVNECLATPCSNGGTCVNTQGSYRCDCVPGTSGTNCELDQRVCGGTALGCGSLLPSDCENNVGCGRNYVCTGTATTACASLFTSTSCAKIAGCAWNAAYSACAGTPKACGMQVGETACVLAGCNWTVNDCFGTPVPCAYVGNTQCVLQAGCMLVAP